MPAPSGRQHRPFRLCVRSADHCQPDLMTTQEKADPVVQLGIDIDPSIEHYTRVALARLRQQGGTSAPMHVRIIRDHDPSRPRPVMVRMLTGTGASRTARYVEGDSPRTAVDELVEQLIKGRSPTAA